MKVYYALYDQSYDNNAQYWTWFPSEITQQMRDAIASKSGAFQMRPKRPNLLSEYDIVGGIINYQDQWCVVYRYFNGGNDPQGRPDRCVLATAWVRTVEAQGQNLYALLFCPVFLDIQKQALYQCPVQVPRALVENCYYPVSQNDPQLVIYNNNPNIGSWSFRNFNEVEVVGKLFPNLIGDGLKSLQVLQSASYMETFSGTPLASGITYVPNIVTQPEPVVYVGGYDYPVHQPPRRFNANTFILLATFLACVSLLAYFCYPIIYTRIIKPNKKLFPHVEIQQPMDDEVTNPMGENPERQVQNDQNQNEQNPEVQTPEGQYPEVQTPETSNPETPTPETPTPETPTPETPNLNWQNPNEQESGRPIINSPTEPNNDMSGMPSIEL